MVQQPSLQQALAVAELVRRRCAAAVAEAQGRCTQLEAEVEQLRAAAAVPQAPPLPQPPLLQIVAEPGVPAVGGAVAPATAAAAAAVGAAAAPLAPGSPEPSEALFRQQVQLESLSLWHRAAALLPPDAQQVLCQAQRYLLLRQLQQPAAAGSPPAASVLEHTPVRALLELAADILSTHAAAATAAPPPAASASAPASAPQQHQQRQQAPLQLSEVHGQLLADAITTLVHLCNMPGQTAVDGDFTALQQFCSQVLRQAAAPLPPEQPAAPICTPDPQPAAQAAQHTIPAGVIPAAAAGQPAAGAADLLRQPMSLLAQQVLTTLRHSASAGMVLLSCTAPQTRDCMAALVATVTGEPLLQQQQSGSALEAGSISQLSGAWAKAGWAAADEALQLHVFNQLSQQLSAGLPLLPQWHEALGGLDESFLKELATTVMSARDTSQLISVTHPAAARQMQRAAAQLINALQQIAGQEAAHGAA